MVCLTNFARKKSLLQRGFEPELKYPKTCPDSHHADSHMITMTNIMPKKYEPGWFRTWVQISKNCKKSCSNSHHSNFFQIKGFLRVFVPVKIIFRVFKVIRLTKTGKTAKKTGKFKWLTTWWTAVTIFYISFNAILNRIFKNMVIFALL